MPTRGEDFSGLVHQLDGVTHTESTRYSSFQVQGHAFGFYWPATETVGLKQLVAEQLALVSERPEVFEVQFTTGQYGWVVVHLEGVDRTELAELTYEAWRLTAPPDAVRARADRLPR